MCVGQYSRLLHFIHTAQYGARAIFTVFAAAARRLRLSKADAKPAPEYSQRAWRARVCQLGRCEKLNHC